MRSAIQHAGLRRAALMVAGAILIGVLGCASLALARVLLVAVDARSETRRVVLAGPRIWRRRGPGGCSRCRATGSRSSILRA